MAAALAGGILVGRWPALPDLFPAVCVPVLLVLWFVVWSRGQVRRAGWLLLLLVATTGAVRQQQESSDARTAASVATMLPPGTDRQLVRLRGTIETEPQVIRRTARDLQAAWVRPERARCEVHVEALQRTDRFLPVAGRIRLWVSGHPVGLLPGDRVEILGWLTRPQPPANPGEFDAASWLASQGISGVLYADHPAAVHPLESGRWWQPPRLLAQLRNRLRLLLTTRLSEAVAPVAAAVLLGDRTSVGDDLQEDFSRSGAMHVLAISGMHAGLFAGMLWFLCRLAGARRRTSAVAVIAGTLGYALLTGARPSVLRAWGLISLVVGGGLLGRHVSLRNSLAAAAIGLMLFSPDVLLNIGAQLSFLAMIAIAACTELPLMRRTDSTPAARLQALQETGPGGQVMWCARQLSRRTLQLALLTGTIWLTTAPLVAARFHLVSLAGLLLNLVLVPLLGLVLWCGYVFLAAALLLPEVAGPVAAAFDFVLRLFLWIVQSGSEFRLAAVTTSSPPDWWLAGYYLMLLPLLLAPLSGRLRWRWLCRTVPAWAGCGVLVAVLTHPAGFPPAFEAPPAIDESSTAEALSIKSTPADVVSVGSGVLRCTFLSQGHGLAVVLRLPDGRVVLYDAGSLASGRRAARIVTEALLHADDGLIDTLVLSHADADHFNGVAGLVRRIPVRQAIMSRRFATLHQRQAAEVCDELTRAGTSLHIAVAGDRLLVGGGCRIDVLHPPAGFAASSDNASSLVLRVRYAGRTLLLTGDLEQEGLWSLLEQPRQSVDVLLAPHHGSLSASPPKLAEWAQPRTVIISTGDDRTTARLRSHYPRDALLLGTAERGAVEVTIDAGGGLLVSPFLANGPATVLSGTNPRAQ